MESFASEQSSNLKEMGNREELIGLERSRCLGNEENKRLPSLVELQI